jgi:hypothetical protein
VKRVYEHVVPTPEVAAMLRRAHVTRKPSFASVCRDHQFEVQSAINFVAGKRDTVTVEKYVRDDGVIRADLGRQLREILTAQRARWGFA